MPDRKILVVDDEILILEVMKEFFEIEGYEITSAQNGQEALEILGSEGFTVMFIDFMLPDMNGMDLCRLIRKDNSDAVIYAFTGYASFHNHEECRAAGFDDFFVKPVDMEILIRATRDAFEKIERRTADTCDLT